MFLTDDSIYPAPVYADGESKARVDLGLLLGAELHLGLASSTRFKSRVVWPPDLAGKDFYAPRPAPARPGLWGWLRHKLLPSVLLEFTPEVRERIGRGV